MPPPLPSSSASNTNRAASIQPKQNNCAQSEKPKQDGIVGSVAKLMAQVIPENPASSTNSQVKREAVDDQVAQRGFSTPERLSKRSKCDPASYHSPTAGVSTSFGTPQKISKQQLLDEARAMLDNIGIPTKAVEKLDCIIANTTHNYAICGSAALAIHAKEARLGVSIPVGDLDIVYTGSVNADTVAQRLRDDADLTSSNTEVKTTDGQIVLVELDGGTPRAFKIDLVPAKAEFATSFTTVGQLEVADLNSLKESYGLTARGGYAEKSEAARQKLEIIADMERHLP